MPTKKLLLLIKLPRQLCQIGRAILLLGGIRITLLREPGTLLSIPCQTVLTLYAKWIENPQSAATSSGASENNSSSSTKLAETGVDAGIFFSVAVAFIAVGSIAIKLIKRS